MYNKSAYYVFAILHVLLGVLTFPSMLLTAYILIGDASFVFLYIGALLTQLSVPLVVRVSKKPMSRFLITAAVIQMFALLMCLYGTYMCDNFEVGVVGIYLILFSVYYIFVLLQALFMFKFEWVSNFMYYHNRLYILMVIIAAILFLSIITLSPWGGVVDFFFH